MAAITASSEEVDSTLFFPLCTFLLSVYTLGASTDVLVSCTAALARRLRVSETLIALLTAGAEWEELAVVIAAVAQHRQKLALGNVLGSCVANILGAFSLGVLAQRNALEKYDVSARIYAVVLFGVTTLVAVLWGFGSLDEHVYGALLVGVFALYLAGITWSVYRGVLDAPEEESDAESGEEGDEDEEEEDDGDDGLDAGSDRDPGPDVRPSTIGNGTPPHAEDAGGERVDDESSALLASRKTTTTRKRRPSTRLFYLLLKLIAAFVALSLSGYVLSHSSTSLAKSLRVSETVFGATLLSLATTLPEKFVAVVSGYRGHPGIMVANTVGSNIFLLTLCLGVTILSSSQSLGGGGSGSSSSSYTNEVVWTWTSSAFLTVMIILGTHRLIGLAMLLAYVAFIVLEFTLYYKP
ncbi:uncharacterized protein Z519_11136 [Cladophialophora bantiana CBS 173.52]|uniref:Sodium/calcium exchanger membrane region domain-containing protein n=1 Tax=Cladophialophora bantiana (strain ATCC 10958 / CBS 173.52 / CDC B-1940 / NIH 8579) TaxID=1442370 RepID=A0A0D2ED62_CLAB1|nr:uncharacterized protein Z519_11136 [Cladophialophora bantiana CBS 173.52]KIW88026.1 hypothetical protein Z519_11136 [Cladophialophora bantiana CBS 173.52]